MQLNNRLTEMLDIQYPIIQAGMAGQVTSSEMVAAVSNAGGLGTLGAGYMTPEIIRKQIQGIKKLTDRPFAVNLFVTHSIPTYSPTEIQNANDRLKPIRDELNLSTPKIDEFSIPFEEQMKVVLEEHVPVFSFTFGMLDSAWLTKLKEAGTIIVGTATTVREAIFLEQAGVDVVVGQGSEAGGHRGTFLGDSQHSLVGTMALIPQMVDHVQIPVIAAGGIMDGRGVLAALSLGADAVQLGTAFLTCTESQTPVVHKELIMNSTEEDTVLTRSFSGKHARGIGNSFITQFKKYEENWPEYPIQNALTQDIRKAASKQGLSDYMSLWAGQGLRLSQKRSIHELMQSLVAETEQTLEHLGLMKNSLK
ncbi:NAD(P)H-dependent flavin oxidoreductase [Hazenella coriacea]|uniref:Probable nitronate monooxygenase n=1 Tax=Hazenella coriacea TaxID=1179467 RepID=A0A4R3L4M7_9BACL|nr:nitronate monooxygenase [Hazenella coriacea]TCS93895.1 nitronate monooxygenase [Hazenella coriacea]